MTNPLTGFDSAGGSQPPAPVISQIRNVKAFQSSMRNFSGWLTGGKLPGAMDLDFLAETHGLFLGVEFKTWSESGVAVPWGQHSALVGLAWQQNWTVILLAETDTDDIYWLQLGPRCKAEPSYVRHSKSMWYKPEEFTQDTKLNFRDNVDRWYVNAKSRPKPRYS